MEKLSKLKTLCTGAKNSIKNSCKKILSANNKVFVQMGKIEERYPAIALPLMVGSLALMVQSALFTVGGIAFAVANPTPANIALGLGVSVAGLVCTPLSALFYTDTWACMEDAFNDLDQELTK